MTSMAAWQVEENKLYTVEAAAVRSGLTPDEVWDELERGTLSAAVYAEGAGMDAPGWRMLPPEGVPWVRAGTRDVIEWNSPVGPVTARCDAGAIRVM